MAELEAPGSNDPGTSAAVVSVLSELSMFSHKPVKDIKECEQVGIIIVHCFLVVKFRCLSAVN